MELGTSKFDVGQRVWLTRTHQSSQYAPCENCHGQPRQFVRWASGVQKEVVCNTCNGSGKGWKALSTTKTDVVWLSGTIWGVSVSMPSSWHISNNDRPEREVMYRLKDIEWLDATDTEQRANIFHEEQMYSCLVDAEAACHGTNDARKAA